ncbi:hypothetical protein KB584_09100 [Streptococcus canis]|uniref:Uncharacterized protein n=1 Tax=Streptococcus canis TaxID=1329 RepID=A0AAE4Q953_STRCB|nr:hypothetical protein [Streptococcus canis]
MKQQNRWNKSFFRESVISIKKLRRKPLVALWTILEIAMVILLMVVVGSFFLDQVIYLNRLKLLAFLVIVLIVALCRNVHYMVKYP